MRLSIGEILVREGMVSKDQLDAALKAQVIYGGRVGTNLVESGVISLDDLTQALSIHFGVPPAYEKHFEQIQPQALALLPKKVAERHTAIPLGLTSKSPKTLAVALVDPLNTQAVDDIAFAAGMRVLPTVAPELRLLFYLEKLYGVQRKARFLRLDVEEPAEAPPSAPAAAPPQPERRRYLEANPAPGPVPASTAASAQALSRMEFATDRDQVGDAVIDFLREGFGYGLLLVVREEMALGWKGVAPGVDHPVLESICIPVTIPSLLKSAFDRKGSIVGPPPPEAAALHARLWRLLRCPAPREVVVSPVVIRDRVVLLVYGHLRGGGPISPQRLSELDGVCASAAVNLTRLVQNAKARV